MKKKIVLNGVTKALSLVTIITLISKVLGLLREVGVASIFGVGIESDALYAAIVIPGLIFTSVGVALQSLFMVEFTHFKEKHPDKKEQSILISKMVNLILVISIILFAISFIFAKELVMLIAPGFTDPYKFNLTVTLTRILLPTLVIIPIYQIKSSVMRVYERFVSTALIDLFFNLAQIIYLFFFADLFGIEGLAYAILIGYLAQLIVIELMMTKHHLGIHLSFDLKDSTIRKVLRLFIPTMISFGVIQINAIVDKVIASSLDDGSITALNYGFMIRNLVYGVIVASLMTVIYPLIIKHLAQNNQKAYNQMIGKTINFFILVLLPLSAILMIFDQEIVKIIFERGLFDASDTILTAEVMLYYTIGMLAFSIKELLIRVSYANHNTKLPLWTTLFGSILNIILSIILKNYMGVSGIALGLSLSEILALFLLIRYMYLGKMFNFEPHVNDMTKTLFITSLMGVILYLLYPYLWLPESFMSSMISLVLYSGIYLALVIFIAHLFKVKLIVEFIALMKGNEHALIE